MTDTERIWNAGARMKASAEGLAADMLRVPQGEPGSLDLALMENIVADVMDSARRHLREIYPDLDGDK